MRILIVTGIFSPDIGGPATYVMGIATALSDRGHNVTVVTLSDGPVSDDTALPFRMVRIRRQMSKPWRWLRTVLSIIRLGRTAQVLFVNGLAMESALANILLRKPMVQKVVGDLAWERATNSGWVRDEFESFQTRRYGPRIALLKALRTWWTRRADVVIVPSKYLAQWVTSWGVDQEKLVVIYNAVGPVNGVQPAQIPLPTPVTAITVGRLVPWKRVDALIEGIAHLDFMGLVVVGEGPERARCEALTRRLGLEERTYFAGARSRDEVLALLSACDIFVLGSAYEGLPHVILEAMALGLPVIAVAAGGTPEVVEDGHTGRLVPEADPQLLAHALRTLAGDTQARKRMGSAGQERARERFGFEELVARTEQTILSTVSARTEGHG